MPSAALSRPTSSGAALPPPTMLLGREGAMPKQSLLAGVLQYGALGPLAAICIRSAALLAGAVSTTLVAGEKRGPRPPTCAVLCLHPAASSYSGSLAATTGALPLHSGEPRLLVGPSFEAGEVEMLLGPLAPLCLDTAASSSSSGAFSGITIAIPDGELRLQSGQPGLLAGLSFQAGELEMLLGPAITRAIKGGAHGLHSGQTEMLLGPAITRAIKGLHSGQPEMLAGLSFQAEEMKMLLAPHAPLYLHAGSSSLGAAITSSIKGGAHPPHSGQPGMLAMVAGDHNLQLLPPGLVHFGALALPGVILSGQPKHKMLKRQAWACLGVSRPLCSPVASAQGGGAPRRGYSTRGGEPDVYKDILDLQGRVRFLENEHTRQVRNKFLRRGLVVIIMAVGGLACYAYGEKMYSDGEKAANDFFRAQAKGPIMEEISNHMSDQLSRMTFGVLGTSKEQQEKQGEAQRHRFFKGN